LPHITFKEIGALAMVCTDLKTLCFRDNDIWKTLYLRTVDWKITDKSVHIGYAHRKRTEAWGPEFHWGGGGGQDVICGCAPATSTWAMPSGQTFNWEMNRLAHDSNCNLYIQGVISTITLCDHAYPCHNQPAEVLNTRREFQDAYIRAWTEHNEKEGLSTVNLCQNPDHYKVETLDIPGCRNYKSFKTITLKKLHTQAKKPIKSLERKLQSQEHVIAWEMNRLEVRLAALRINRDNTYTELGRVRCINDKIFRAIVALKPKPKPKKVRKKKEKVAKKSGE
jgi:hypothetical protein